MLLTGVGKGSIGVEIINGLLSGSAHIYYQSIFQSLAFSSRSSALIIVPFNQALKQDVEVLVDYIYANSAWIWTTSHLSLVSPKMVKKLMGWTLSEDTTIHLPLLLPPPTVPDTSLHTNDRTTASY